MFDFEGKWHHTCRTESVCIRLTGIHDDAGILLTLLPYIARSLIQDYILTTYKDRSDKEMEKLISWLKDEIDVCVGYDLPRQHLENIINALDDVSTVKN